MNPSFWAGKNVLVTGHTGFKGSWFCLWLQSLGAEVTGYALEPATEPNLFALARVGDGMAAITGDVRDLEHLRRVVATHRPEIVIHMAAQAIVSEGYEDPVGTYASNVMGTVNVLEAVRKTDTVRVVVCVTSDKCYANREWVWGYRENEPMGGRDPYSSSKGCSELVVSAYRDSFFTYGTPAAGVAVASARAGNVIGGGDWARDRLIPDVVTAFIENRAAEIRNPTAVRNWQHVLEPLSGYGLLAERLWEEGSAVAEGWNFGTDDREVRPVGWVVERMANVWGAGARWTAAATDHPPENHWLRLDCSKANARLGWSSKLDVPTALEWTVEWYREFARGADPRTLTEGQIERYSQHPRSPAEPAGATGAGVSW